LAQGARRFVSSSGGNAGLAVAYVGRLLGVPVTVVVPETTTDRANELLRQESAEVIVQGSSWQEANDFARSLIGATDAFLHPFDDPLLWAGHATLRGTPQPSPNPVVQRARTFHRTNPLRLICHFCLPITLP
jgi:L-serine/L-threonine ammonia-lyase